MRNINTLYLSIIVFFLSVLCLQVLLKNKNEEKNTINKNYSSNIKVDNLNVNLKNEQNYLNEKVQELEKKYNITIKIKEKAIIAFPDFSANLENNNKRIFESLLKIEFILSKYNKDFFNSFYDNEYNGLNIYLTSTLTPSDYETQISNPAAYSLVFNNEYMIVIDINQTNIEELLCHELMHNLEFQLNNEGIIPFKEWENYNPENFYYNYDYTKEYVFNYTLDEDELINTYFIDKYSHTYPAEDRARIFEKICSCNKKSFINDYINLYIKGAYLKDEIIKYYPSLKDSSLFNSLN